MVPPPPGAYVGPIVVADAGGTPLSAGAGCTLDADGRVTCPPHGSTMVLDVDAGDGDDTVLSSADAYTTLRGGDGDDDLDVSGADSATLLGGPGDDVLTGGPGVDTLNGGTGHDRLRGGAGLDTVTYRDRDDPIQATIGAPQPGDEDAIGDDVEVLTGGRGPDRLTGSDRRDYLDGGPGADVLDGRDGDDDLRADGTVYADAADEARPTPAADDTLLGGPGDDVLTLSRGGGGHGDGGPGADTIGGTGAATLAGGPGRDRMSLLGSGGTVVADDDGAAGDQVGCAMLDMLGRRAAGTGPRAVQLGPSDVSNGCTRALHRSGAAPGALAISYPEPVDQGASDARSSLLALACADDARRGCAARITVLDDHGRAVGRARRALKAGGYAQVTVRFSKAYTRRLSRARALPVTFVASMRDTRGRVRSDRLAYCAQAVNAYVDSPASCGTRGS
jgi:Ca2+-binding RTX toxin-like protein